MRRRALHVGFNYRFYEGISHAVRDIRRGRFGTVVSIELYLPWLCSGPAGNLEAERIECRRGCLIDPEFTCSTLHSAGPNGVKPVGGSSWHGFWNTGIEEEVSLLLQADEFSINMRISLVAWRSTFLMRIMDRWIRNCYWAKQELW